MPKTQTRGWQLTLTHPTTGRTVSVDVLDNPEFDPSLNSLVTARIPVRKSEDLLEWPSGTEIELSLDGRKQPLDEVVDFEQEADQTIIVAEGGVELDNRVRTEYQEERRHIAAEEIIEQETAYAADVDTPEFPRQDDVLLQEATTTLDFEDLALEIENTDPIDFSGDTIQTLQSGYLVEAEDADSFDGSTFSDSDLSGGTGVEFGGIGDRIQHTFTIDYPIPAESWDIFSRDFHDGVQGEDSSPRIQVFLDGDPVSEDEIVGRDLDWSSYAFDNDFILSPGEHTIEIEYIDGDVFYKTDLIGLFDTRFNYNFDNEVNEPDGFLDGPETHPNAFDVTFDDATTPFVISESTATLSIDDTSNEQAVALSPDRGASFVEAQNSDTVTAEDLETPQVRLRITLSRHSPDGPREQTPRFGYASQTIDSFEITADIRQESLLIDQTYDNNVESVLNEIAGDEYIWSYRLENGTGTVAWSQPGQREATTDPDIDAEVRVSKNIKTWDAVTIKGSAQSVSGERFSGSTTFRSLNRENIVPGSESVSELDGDTDFRRGEDYEMRYNDGEIRILGSGDMDGGTEYEIDYRFEVEGTFPQDYEGSNELVETLSGVVSDRQAQQLAYTILEIDPGVRFPSYSADVLLPRGDLFDPLEALSLEQLQLPDEATPIEIREQPQRTPQGLALRLGAKDPLSGLNRLSNQLQSVSRRS